LSAQHFTLRNRSRSTGIVGHDRRNTHFINDTERQSAVLEDVSILLSEGRLTSLKDLLPLPEEIVKAARPLLVIAEEVDNDSLAALVINTIRGTLRTCTVKSPGFGERRKAMVPIA
jgi:chaperonin GroEL